MSGQTLNDRLTAAKHTLAGQGLARIVCKATTEEVIGPKKKHLDHLLHCTNEPNVSIPQLANLLIERTQHSSWVVVFKALITVHHLMCYGNDRFTQYLASSNCTFQLGSFIDKCGVQGYDMSTFIRRYAKYLNEKAIAYRTVAFDFCKCKRGKEDGILRTMNIEKLLKTLPSLQNQLDALLEFDCSSNDLSNGVVNSCFMLLFRDLIRLFACYNDGIINLLEKYFEMNKKHCRDALDIYKKFLIRMDRVAEFLKVAENVGIDKGEIPDLTKLTETCRYLPRFETNNAPSSLLEALESHLAALEGRKGSASAASAATRATNLQNAVSALSHTSNAFGSAGENATMPQEVNGVKVDESVRKAVEEEAEVMSQLKFDKESPLLWEQPAWEDSERRMKEVAADVTSPPSGISKTNPFLASPSEPAVMQSSGQGLLDLFSSEPVVPSSDGGDIGGASDNLLGLNNNPFADSLFDGAETAAPAQPAQDQAFASFGMNGFATHNTNAASSFASDASFAAAFGDSTPTAPEKSTVKLNLPVMEPFGGRSTSPSPTTDLMRGAGTTPILASLPDGAFGEAAEPVDEPASHAMLHTNQDTADFAWSTSMSSAQQATTPDPFGAAFEPASSSATATPTAVVRPLTVKPDSASQPNVDFFGLDSSEFGDIGEQPTSAQPCAPPPSPFGGFDLPAFGSMSPSEAKPQSAASNFASEFGAPEQKQSPLATGFDNLNFAIHQSMQMPPALSPTSFAAPLPPGFGSQPLRPVNTCPPPPGSTPTGPMSFGQLDSLGGLVTSTPVRASSTPGYGTPPSGLSSPAKSVGGAASLTGGFDAFGDMLQPQTPTGKPSAPEKAGGSILKGDLDSTLASLASNLDINGPKQSLKKMTGHQWGSPKPPAKTAGAPTGWAGAPGAAPGAGMAPNMGWGASPQHGFQSQAAPGQWSGGFPQQQQPAPGVLPQQPYMARPGAPMGMPIGTGVGMAATQPMAQQPPQGMFSGFGSQMPMSAPQSTGMPSQAAPVNDPFGAL